MNDFHYNIVVIGAGPAGLQAAIHAVRTKLSVLVLGKPDRSSIYNARLENYCCINLVAGNDLLDQGKNQAEEQGALFIEEDVIAISGDDASVFKIRTESDNIYTADAVIFATGVSRKKLNIPGEKEFLGRGVSYCVDCDANFFKNLPVAVIGNESAAVSGALTLTSFSEDVSLVCSKLKISEDLSVKLKYSSVKLYENVSVKEISGEYLVEELILDNGRTLKVRGVFIELGAKGLIELAGLLGIELYEDFKFILVNKRQETNVPGIYAAGDICGPPWQVAKAIGEGCVAGLEAAKYVKGLNTD